MVEVVGEAVARAIVAVLWRRHRPAVALAAVAVVVAVEVVEEAGATAIVAFEVVGGVQGLSLPMFVYFWR